MDNIINNLIEIDQKARTIVKEAEDKSKEILDSINLSRREFEIKYDDKASIRLKKVKEEESEKIKESCRKIKNKYMMLTDKLERAYFSKHEEIETQIFERVIKNF